MAKQFSPFRPRPMGRSLLVGVCLPQTSERVVRECLQELTQLTETAGGEVVDQAIFLLTRPDPAFFLTRGKAAELASRAAEHQVEVVIFDDDLTPAQERNLERLVGCRVIDRTQVILDIFALHAHTKAGRLQVGLAQMEYLLPRLRRMWTHLERQRGGIGVRGGPGEQQLEVDRRRIKNRIAHLKKELSHVERHRQQLRKSRRRHGWAVLCLVGYTNAGKSTLLNRLTAASVEVNDKLFVTLDPVTRKLKLPDNQSVLITDTVGFIRKLPHQLVEAFHATLEEVVEADLLLHVVDASHHEAESQIQAVNQVLSELGATEQPVIGVLNKIDLSGGRERANRLAQLFQRAVPLSALTGEGIDSLLAEIADALRAHQVAVRLKLPSDRGDLLAMARASGKILAEAYDNGYVWLHARLPVAVASRLRHYCSAEREKQSDET